VGQPLLPVPALPAWKAFVVQFDREADLSAEHCSGRIEHLNSGRRIEFHSPDELVQGLRGLLQSLGDASAPGE
jgi:hypothetical protein